MWADGSGVVYDDRVGTVGVAKTIDLWDDLIFIPNTLIIARMQGGLRWRRRTPKRGRWTLVGEVPASLGVLQQAIRRH